MGTVGGRGKFTIFLLRGALEALRWRLELNKMGMGVPLKVNGVGHYVLSAVSLRKEYDKSVGGPTYPSLYI